jgi:hypothetical protein
MNSASVFPSACVREARSDILFGNVAENFKMTVEFILYFIKLDSFIAFSINSGILFPAFKLYKVSI